MPLFEELARLDRLLHEPARLAVLTALASCTRADFLFLQRLTGLTKGNLSSHLLKLEEAGLVDIDKRFRGKVPTTVIALTPVGRAAIAGHWRQLERLGRDVRVWDPREEPHDGHAPVGSFGVTDREVAGGASWPNSRVAHPAGGDPTP